MDNQQHAGYVKRYREEFYPLFETYAEVMQKVLVEAKKQYAPLSVVQARPKSISSFAEKIIRKGYQKPFVQMTDLCGARIITVTEAEVRLLSAFIEAHFDVDFANSLDVGARLKAREFGYRSVHYVVQLRPGKCLGVKVPREILPTREVPFKAEIQVRTMLQHGWSEVLHDRIYKNKIQVPVSLEREGARLAALLEEGDGLITRVVKDIDAFVVDIGAYMKAEDVQREVTDLEVILGNEKTEAAQEKIALRMSKLLRAGNQWLAINALLHPFVKKTRNAALLREYGHALCEGSQEKPRSADYVRGQEILLTALELAPENADTHALLARSYLRQPRASTQAHRHLREAYHLAPDNPYHFAAYIEYELRHAPSEALLPLLLPVIKKAVETCERHISVGIELPRAYLALGKFRLLLGDVDGSLEAYAKGVHMVIDRKSGVCTDCLEQELDALARLDTAAGGMNNGKGKDGKITEALRRVFLMGLYLANGDLASLSELNKVKKHTHPSECRVLIIAGGGSKEVEKAMNAYGGILKQVLADFEGVVIGGGTRAGISGVVGKMKNMTGRDFKTLGYLPSAKAADSRYDKVIKSDTREFSPFDPIQAWVDVIASGIKPEQVSVLGFNGGAISAVEYRLGLAFGASVGVVAGSGRAADALLEDVCWRELGPPLGLLNDPMTLRAFIISGTGAIPPQRREELARAIHITYCGGDTEDLNKRILKDNGLPWEKLPETYKDANYAQADYIGEILKTEHFNLIPVKGTADNSSIVLEPEQIERMAEMEHGRWNVDRLRDGWRPGKRDDAKKTHDCLVSWEELPDNIKQYDRDSVNSWPKLLAGVGIEIRK